MFVIPVTFYAADGKTVVGTGELITDVSIAAQSWKVLPAPNGTEYSASPLGNPPVPTANTVPNFLNQTASFSVNVLTSYFVPTSGLTAAYIGPSLSGTGFAFDGTHLTYDGTTVSSLIGGMKFRGTLISTGVTVDTNLFSCQGNGAPITDNTPPTIPLAVAVSSIGTSTATIGGLQSSDPQVPGASPTGLKQYNLSVKVAGVNISGSPFPVPSGGLGLSPILIPTDIGPQTSVIVQVGPDVTITTTAVDAPYPTSSALGGVAMQVTDTGTGIVMTAEIDALTSTNAFDNLRLEMRPALTATGAYVAGGVQPFNQPSGGVFGENRAAAGGSATKQGFFPLATGPVRLIFIKNGDVYSFGYTVDGNNPINVFSLNQPMGNVLYLMAAGNTNSGGPLTGTIKQINIQTLANWNKSLSGLAANTAHSVTVTAQDQANNVSAASQPVIFTTATSGGGGGGSDLNPHIAVARFGGGQQYGSAYRALFGPVAQIHFINGAWESWGSTYGGRQNLVLAMKAASSIPGGTKVIQYVINDTYQGASGQPSWAAYAQARNWALYINGRSGSVATSFYNSSWTQTNSAAFVTPDANGRMLEDAFAAYCDTQFRTSGGANAAIALDGFFKDNLFNRARSNGDFNCDGTTDNAQADPFPLYWRTGQARFFTYLQGTFPTGLMFGNLDDPYNGNPLDTSQYAPLTGMLNGGLFEGGAGGFNFSPSSFAQFLQQYRFRIAVASRAGKNGMISCGAQINATGGIGTAWGSSGAATSYGNNWQGMRYSLTKTMLDVGYWHWALDNNYADTQGLYNFDECGGNTAQYPAGYLGARTGSVPTAAAVKGCWISTFANGISICNPQGNGTRSLTNTDLSAYNGGVLYRLRGPQNPSFNNAVQVTSGAALNLADSGTYGDGAILMYAPQ